MGEGWRYVARGLTRIEAFMADEGADCDYAPTGYIEARLRHDSPVLFDRYRDYIDAIGQGEAKTLLSSDEIAAEFDTPYLGAGLYDPRGGQLNPLKLLRQLKAAAERLGARCFENSPVIGVDVSGPTIRISTGMGTVTCSKLVLASNGYTHLLAGLDGIGASTLQRPMLIRAGVTAPLTSAQWEAVGWSRRCGVNVLSDLFYSFAPRRGRWRVSAMWCNRQRSASPSGPLRSTRTMARRQSTARPTATSRLTVSSPLASSISRSGYSAKLTSKRSTRSVPMDASSTHGIGTSN